MSAILHQAPAKYGTQTVPETTDTNFAQLAV